MGLFSSSSDEGIKQVCADQREKDLNTIVYHTFETSTEWAKIAPPKRLTK